MTTDTYTPGDVQTAIERFRERGFKPGMTTRGRKIHAVDFDSDSVLVAGTDGATDKLLCGLPGEFMPIAETPTSPQRWCTRCLSKVLSGTPAFLGGGDVGGE